MAHSCTTSSCLSKQKSIERPRQGGMATARVTTAIHEMYEQQNMHRSEDSKVAMQKISPSTQLGEC